MKDCILLRYGEVGLKSKRTRVYFEKKYIEAIKQALERNNLEYESVVNLGGRFILYLEDPKSAIGVLKSVPGIQSLSEAKSFEFKKKEEIVKKITLFFKEKVVNKKFYVTIKRVGKHEFGSMEVTREIGEILLPYSNGVSASNPEVIVSVEIRNNNCSFFTSIQEGMGGLPSGTAGKVLCLFSGGIDSPVAAYEMIRRGCYVDFLFVNIVDKNLFGQVANIYNYIINKYCFIHKPKMFVVDGKEIVNKIKKEVPDNLRQIAYKIALYKISEEILKKTDYDGIVTGESISQKSSQTLKSLSFIQEYSNIFILRPLLSADKKDIMHTAAKIGTLSSSEKIKEYCSLSEGPVTTAPILKNKKDIPDFTELVRETIKSVKIFTGLIEVEEKDTIKLEHKQVISVDVRNTSVQKNNPIEADWKIDIEKYEQNKDYMNSFEKDKSYLLICKFGVCSETIASELRKKGVNALGISLKNYLKLKELKKI